MNAALPIVIAVLIGTLLHHMGILKRDMLPALDSFAFNIGMPLLMFTNISSMDFYSEFDPGFMLYCFLISLASFSAVWIISLKLFSNRSMAGAFAQASVRGSISLLAVAITTHIYGSAGIASLMIAAAVPVYNIMSVFILTFCGSGEKANGYQIKKALKSIITNPLILGIAAGLPFALLRIEIPDFIDTPISNLAHCATPIGLMSMGASFNLSDATARLKPALAASAIKLLVLPGIGVPIAVLLGFRGEMLTCIMLMLGSATTPASYIMAKQMGCDGPLSSNVVILTQVFFAVTLTFWLFILKTLTLI